MVKTPVYIACSGLGFIKRGFERHCSELHQLLLRHYGPAFLVKGAGPATPHEIVLSGLKRHHVLTRVIGYLLRRHPYEIQGIFFAMRLLFLLSGRGPAIVYIGEPAVYRILNKRHVRRRWSITVVFFTGGHTIPRSFFGGDLLHHVTEESAKTAGQRGFPRASGFLLPHFLTPRPTPSAAVIRKQWNIPVNKKVILSVGAIDKSVKRMDYLIREFARLDQESDFLLIAGEEENETPALKRMAAELLRPENYRIVTLKPEEVADLYAAADVFVLASLREGFGLVFLEALHAGLPVIAHDFEIARWVTGPYGKLIDMTVDGGLASVLRGVTGRGPDAQERSRWVMNRFAADALAPGYIAMFNAAGGSRNPQETRGDERDAAREVS